MALVDSAVVHVRLESGNQHFERLSLGEFIEEVEVGAAMEANAQGLTLAVGGVEANLYIEVDRSLLMGAVSNLLQNAFKFTRREGRVSLTTAASVDRVSIAVEDQCGGLPAGKINEMFRPFEQFGANRRGLGLGLSIARRSVQANGGELRVRDISGVGCVFTIDLPRFPP
jgi:hypothetical protein